MYKSIILGLLVSLSSVSAHIGHEHANEAIQESAPAAAERPSISGKMFEVVLETCKDKAILYLSDAQTNQSIADATMEVTVNGDKASMMKAEVTKTPGSYSLALKKNEGEKVNLELKVKSSKGEETLTLNVSQWPKASETCSG